MELRYGRVCSQLSSDGGGGGRRMVGEHPLDGTLLADALQQLRDAVDLAHAAAAQLVVQRAELLARRRRRALLHPLPRERRRVLRARARRLAVRPEERRVALGRLVDAEEGEEVLDRVGGGGHELPTG